LCLAIKQGALGVSNQTMAVEQAADRRERRDGLKNSNVRSSTKKIRDRSAAITLAEELYGKRIAICVVLAGFVEHSTIAPRGSYKRFGIRGRICRTTCKYTVLPG
jgi:hypothetical protein